ncbi:CBS domain-containing protein [Paenibacillus oenotherae]|uniref:CBS domain-containing protein n=1 Tax=Paenibacillus oenotherae TaxID=1435645 RepID=A0ABS7D3P1_9BACL|nr:CBS domain-containing protein [Paenibacillus oenotherae]MBW7474542.1 CBS domain-containing protein [Paenibacillus oenotherae]
MEIVKLVKLHAPITGDGIAEMLGISKPTLRADLSLLVMLRLLEAKPKVGYSLGDASNGRENGFKRWQGALVKDVQGMPINVAETVSVHDAVITLFMGNAEALTVVDEQQHFVGVVTPKDLLKITLGNPNAASIPVSMAMNRLPSIVAVRSDQPLLDAVNKMLMHEMDGLPVVSGGEVSSRQVEVTGWISKTNIIRWMTETELEMHRQG